MTKQLRHETLSRPPTAMIASGSAESDAHQHPFRFVCPQCFQPLQQQGEDELYCAIDEQAYRRIDGIWRLLAPQRAPYFEQFISEYETVRRAEGRGSTDPIYYRSLPEHDITGRFAEDWRIRAKSYRELEKQVLRPLEIRLQRKLTVIDIGAGNGWLANRIAARGHHVAALDLLTNNFDGLGTHTHYETQFVPVQAEFDRLPLASDQVDLVIFNGSIHYSTRYETTLLEALRVLREDGLLVILDSPVYRDPSSGEQMVVEREALFERKYGFPSNALPCENYLTIQRLDELSSGLNLTWRLSKPFYGWHWTIRPLKARLRRHREPAQFFLIVGQRDRATTRTDSPFRPTAKKLWKRWLRLKFRIAQRHRYNRLVLENVDGYAIVVLPEVFNPVLFRSGEFLAQRLDRTLIPPGSSVLDMGTGSGVAAVAAAATASRVLAVDINPAAVRCARINALLNKVEHRVEVRRSDLFETVGGERFDIVLFNPPYFRGTPQDALDHAWRSSDVVERFASQLTDHLTPEGRALVVLSSDGDHTAFLDAFRDSDLVIEHVAHRDLINESLTIYRLTPERR